MHAITDLPDFIVLPFADSGDKTAIPVTTASPGRASLTDGFPALNRTPIASGGIPPDGTDMNGVLWETTAWSRWIGAGSAVPFDATFSTAIGGYPRMSVVTNTAYNGQYLSLINNNTNDPNSTGTGWMNLIPVPVAITATGTLTIRQQGIVSVDATAGNITLTLPGASSALAIPIRYDFVRQDLTANTVTISRAGANTIEGVTSISLPAGRRISMISDGGNIWRLMSMTGSLGSQLFGSSGTFTTPSGIYRVKVTVTGAGGGGSGCNTGQGGAGGAAGATAVGYYPVSPGLTVAVTVGTAGAPGGPGLTGGTGGTSSFGSFASASGGAGGDVTNGGGFGGTASGGEANAFGGDGGDGGGPSNGLYGGNGGASFWGGGGRAGSTVGGGGRAGLAYGSGGGGAYANGGGSSSGGGGANGCVFVEWDA